MALVNTDSTESRFSGWMKFWTKFLPMVSPLVYPSMSAALRFHSFTMPLRSTPKIGALAVSMSRDKSSAIRSWSLVISRIWVMSCPTPITPVISPSAPRRVVAFSKMAFLSPRFVNSGNSKLAVSLPAKAARSTEFTECLNSSVIKLSTSDLPMVSRFVKPNKFDALTFHSVTLPCLSIPKIGAFAVSIRRMRSSAMRLDSALAASCSVMSCPTPTTPTILPFESRRVVALSSTE
mmetsp:Transcript_64172/g.196289  ORF Transcript_64172/g.196289 Transcript_64172/m.196289 type:complete len:235 (+) Transcript_64172:25-729(+)